jgi:hypothetical protein
LAYAAPKIGQVAWGLLILPSCVMAVRLWPRSLELHPQPLLPVWSHVNGRDVVSLPGRFLVADLGTYEDEFYAYLMFTSVRRSRYFEGAEVLLTYREHNGRIVYPIRAVLRNNLIRAVSLLGRVEHRGLARHTTWRFLTGEAVERLRRETRLFRRAYNLPVRTKLEELPRSRLTRYIRRWLRFKSATDGRIQRKLERAPPVLNSEEARRRAEDIVSVAAFYSIPLDFFLGIGAMENNYMDAPGDLEHTTWKRRPEKGDIVLKRARSRALVVNSSIGAWQITRETLRYAHRLYWKDTTRDYGRLPAHLRPPDELDVTHVDPPVLTTYAGLLFRGLLDRCGGDVTLATGAYNGGLAKPNLRYAEGVRRVADYARKMLEHAAVLNGPAAGRHFAAVGR